MRLTVNREKGFTLIELLIVVAILGVLAAIVIPNVGRFIGAGEEEAKATEFATIQSAVHAMMTDNDLRELANPVDTWTKNMHLFPDANTTAADKGWSGSGDTPSPGYVLFEHDIVSADGQSFITVNYVATNTTAYSYTIDSMGTVTQSTDEAE